MGSEMCIRDRFQREREEQRDQERDEEPGETFKEPLQDPYSDEAEPKQTDGPRNPTRHRLGFSLDRRSGFGFSRHREIVATGVSQWRECPVVLAAELTERAGKFQRSREAIGLYVGYVVVRCALHGLLGVAHSNREPDRLDCG